MDNNFNLRSRNMDTAGRFALHNAVLCGLISFSSKATYAERWGYFIVWLIANTVVKKMERITFSIVKDYGNHLAIKEAKCELSVATVHNYLSSVNTVLKIATRGRWKSVSPTRDCGIPHRNYVRTEPPKSYDQVATEKCVEAIRSELGDRAASIVEQSRAFGFRSKEVSLANPKTMSIQAKDSDFVTVTKGTKGGRPRKVPLLNPNQKVVLDRAATLQGKDRSLMPADKNWHRFREGQLRSIREAVKKHLGATGLHDLRVGYCCELYETLTGFPAPLFGGAGPDKQSDANARLIIAKAIGHNRTKVTNCYIGGKRK